MMRPSAGRRLSPADPAARYTAAANTAAVYAYSDNYLVDLKHAVMMDVEATTAIRRRIAGGTGWRANEIGIRHLTHRTATRYRLATSPSAISETLKNFFSAVS